MSHNGKKSGFTLVELMMAAVVFSVVVLAVGLVLISAWRGWRDDTELVGMQRDAMVAMRILEKEVRNSNIDEVSVTADGIDFLVISSRTNAFVFSAADEIAFNPGVQFVSWNSTAMESSIVVRFTLQTKRCSEQQFYQKTLYPRN